MADRELLEALHKMEQTMDRVGKIQYLSMIHQQEMEKNRTPTGLTLGSYNFNPSSSATQLAAWRQIVPRNPRRKALILSALNQTLYLATGDTFIDINRLITDQQNGFNGSIAVMQYTFTAGQPLVIETTEALYAASLTGAGSLIELNAVLNFAEEIFSDVTAIPFDSHDVALNRQGRVANMTSGLMSLDEDERSGYTREGVR